ncbi:MAG: hypothetical protein Q9165_001684 [Trypethelium subeluteriae]
MLLRPSFQPGSCLRSTAQSWKRRPRIPRLVQARLLHNVPTLNHDKQWKEHGVGDLLDPQSYKLAWTDYQSLMVQKINDLTIGTPEESKSTKELLLAHARDPLQAALFNYASMAYNNHFFFEALASARSTTTIPTNLANPFITSFGSLDTLRDELLATAEAMFGPGFVWLVQSQDQFRILTTYLAGSPLAGAHTRLQPVDMNTQSVGSAGGLTGEDYRRQTEVQNSLGNFGDYSEGRRRPGGLDVLPVLCVNTWEHVWLPLYGIAGKRHYLERWWENVDWNVVMSRSRLSRMSRENNFHRT